MLCGSDSESVSVSELLSLEPGAHDKLGTLRLGYTESTGSPSLREEISRMYSTVEPDGVLVFAGAEEAIFLFMHALLGPEDHIIVHRPCYQSLYEVARSAGAEVTSWSAREQDGWALDVKELERHIRPATRAIVLNTPHNPTGYLMPERTFREVARIAEERGIVLFSDEVYRESEHDPADRLPAGCDCGPRAVSLGVMSKTYGLPGLRIGWVATRNKDLLARMAALKDYTTICSSAPSELLAEVALRHRDRLATRNLDIIRHNIPLVEGLFARHRDLFSWVKPKAGPIAFPRYLGGKVDDFTDALLSSTGVLLLPGTMYGDTENHFRIGFGRKNAPEAIAVLDEHLQKLKR